MYFHIVTRAFNRCIPVHTRRASLLQKPAVNSVITCTSSIRMSSNESREDVPINQKSLNKTRFIASELLKKRLQNKAEGRRSLVQNTASLQVIGTNCRSSGPSILVQSEGRSYMFNCSEGTQRFCYANKIKLLNMENIFITNHCWERVAGSVGLSLTLQDIGATNINIKSADGIENLFKSTDQFMQFNTGMKCLTSTYHQARHEDSGIIIEAIPIEQEIKTSNSPDSVSDSSSKRLKSISKLVAYSCKLPDLPGHLNAQKCKELGVPIGRDLALLKSGKDIVLKNGTVVKSTDVCGEKYRGLQFIVIECPSKSYIDNMKTNARLQNLTNMRLATSEGQQIDLVIHFSPPDVTCDPDYGNWIDSFDESCRHLLLSSEESAMLPYMLDSYRMHYLLRKLDDQLFSQLKQPSYLEGSIEDSEARVDFTEDKKGLTEEEDREQEEESCFTEVDYDKELSRIYHLNILDKITLRPHKLVELMNKEMPIDSAYQLAKQADPEFEQLLTKLKESQKNLPQPKSYEPEVVFMGTGSAQPSKYRNTSCILINFTHPNAASVMLDCGEDSYGQLLRYYGLEETKRVLNQLKIIYVSHHHADHHIGLIRLLLERKQLTKEPVWLLLPPGIEQLLDYHNQNFENLKGSYEIFSTSLLKAKNPSSPSNSSNQQFKSNFLQSLNHLLEDVQTTPVLHCPNSYAVLFRFKIGHPEMKGFSIAYSGDARPSASFASMARGCDLLIHEATFDYRSTDDAISKKHCTSTEAIEVSKSMNSKFTILTHFSQRLAKVPYFTAEFDDRIGFAFDSLTVKCPSQLRRLPILKPILRSVFREFLDDLDMKYARTIGKQKVAQELLKNNVS